MEFEATFVIPKPILLSAALISLLFLSVHFMIPIHILGRKNRERENGILRYRGTFQPVWVVLLIQG